VPAHRRPARLRHDLRPGRPRARIARRAEPERCRGGGAGGRELADVPARRRRGRAARRRPRAGVGTDPARGWKRWRALSVLASCKPPPHTEGRPLMGLFKQMKQAMNPEAIKQGMDLSKQSMSSKSGLMPTGADRDAVMAQGNEYKRLAQVGRPGNAVIVSAA